MLVRSRGVWFGFVENMFMFQQLLVLVSTALRLGNIKYLILMLEICIITVIVKGHVYCWKYHPCINQYNIFRLYIGMRMSMNLKVYILPPLSLIFSQAMLNIVVYQMLIVTNVPVNSAALQQFMQCACVTLLLILVDTGLKKLYLPLLVTAIPCTM